MPKWLKIVLIAFGAFFLFGAVVLGADKTVDGAIVFGVLALVNLLPALLVKPRALDPEKAAEIAARKADAQAAKAAQRAAADAHDADMQAAKAAQREASAKRAQEDSARRQAEKQAEKEKAAADKAAAAQATAEAKARKAKEQADAVAAWEAEKAHVEAIGGVFMDPKPGSLAEKLSEAAPSAAGKVLTPQQQLIADKKAQAQAAGLACCPRCGSTSLTANKKGFGAGKAVVGAVLVGPYGLLAGGLGSGKVTITCLNCGYKFKPGQNF